MKNRATLSLIELSIMLVVFALAAVLCLKGFLWADETAAQAADRDQALVLAQNTAEVIKARTGDLNATAELLGGIAREDTLVILYDENWAPTDDMHTYSLRAEVADSGLALLGQANIRVAQGDNTLAQLEVCWQEVDSRG